MQPQTLTFRNKCNAAHTTGRSRTPSGITRLLLALLAVFLAIPCVPVARAQANAIYQFNLPEQTLAEALRVIGQQTATNILFDPESVINRTAPAVRAKLTATQAIEHVLRGTDLVAKQSAADTVLVQPAATRASASAQESSLMTANEDTPGDAARAQQEIKLAQSMQKVAEGDAKAQADPSSKQEEPKQQSLQEIVVTAQKQEQSLQETPISVAVLSGEKLDKSTARGLVEELNFVPGVAITTGLQAEANQIVIRGVATDALFTGTSNVGYYVDGGPFAFIRQGYVPDLTPFDLERVEVLKGPQGTLYGAGALAGVVNILTHDPDLDAFDLKLRGLLSSTRQGGLNYGGDAAANIPILPGLLAARLVVSEHEDAGWIDAPLSGEKNRNAGERRTYRLKVKAQPTSELTLDFSAWLTRNHTGAPAVSRENFKQELVTFPEPIDVDYDNYVFKAGYDFGSFAVTSTTSRLDYQLESVLDLATIGIPIPLQSNFGAESWSQEINLASTANGPWSWNLGLFYRDALENLVSIVGPIAGPFEHHDLDYTSESYAVFGELTHHFIDDRLRMTLGLRYFDDHATFKEKIPFDFDTTRPLVESEKDFKKFTTRAVLTWLPNDDFTMYASFGQGYRSGLIPDAYAVIRSYGFAASAAPDSLNNYEIGTKGALFDDRVQYEAAVFYIDWNNYRNTRPLVFCRPLGDECLPTGVLGNFGKASGFGAEGAVTAEVIDGLKIAASLSWNGLEIKSLNVRPDNSPEWTAGGSVDYVFPIGGGRLEGVFSLSANYQSQREIAGGTAIAVSTDSSFFVNSSLSLNAGEHWSASLYVDNLTDEYRTVSAVGPASFPDWLVRQRPRTIGVTASYRY